MSGDSTVPKLPERRQALPVGAWGLIRQVTDVVSKAGLVGFMILAGYFAWTEGRPWLEARESAHKADLADQRVRFVTSLKEIAEEHRAELKAVRDSCEQKDDKFLDALNSLRERDAAQRDKDRELSQRMLIELKLINRSLNLREPSDSGGGDGLARKERES